MSARESDIIERLDAIEPGDPEAAHGAADAILLDAMTPAIRDAYDRLVERVGAWWYA